MTLSVLPPDSKLWIFTADKEFDQTQQAQIASVLSEFFKVWNSHSHPVNGEVEFFYNRFVVISGHCGADNVSGCSTDSLFRVIKQIEEAASVKLEQSGKIFYKDNGQVQCVTSDEFEGLVKAGKVNSDTIVFNNSISSLSEFNSGKWETTFGNSWHSKRFAFN